MTAARARRPAPKRRRLTNDVRRDELLELGLGLFARQPYDAVSTDDIAAAAGVSKGLLYHYFPAKRDFYIASLELAANRLLALTEPDGSLPKVAQLHQSLDAYLAYVERYGESFSALLKGGVGSDPEAAAIVERIRALSVTRVLGALSVTDAAGRALPETPPALRIAVRGWVGFIDAASLEWITRRAPARDAVLGMIVAALVALLDVVRAADPAIRIDVG